MSTHTHASKHTCDERKTKEEEELLQNRSRLSNYGTQERGKERAQQDRGTEGRKKEGKRES